MATAWNSYGQRRDRIGKRQQAANQFGGNGTPPSNSTTPTKPGFRPLNTSAPAPAPATTPAPAQGGISRGAPAQHKPVGVYRPPAARREIDNKEVGFGERKVNHGNANAHTTTHATSANANEQKQAEFRHVQSQVPHKSSSFKTAPYKSTKSNNIGYQGVNQGAYQGAGQTGTTPINSSAHRTNQSGQRAFASGYTAARQLEANSQQAYKPFNKHQSSKTFEPIHQASKSSRPFARLVGIPFGHVHSER